MPTADNKVNIYEKRLLSLTAIKDNFLDFLTDEIDEIVSAIFQSLSGVLDADTIGLTSGANDTFDLDLTNASRVVVGTGQIIDLSLITGAGITSAIPFENTNTDTYFVGIKFAEIEQGIEINPRTGDPEYPALKQTYGELGTPDLVTDNTTSIRVRINSITESGVDHSGRTVRVWLADPVSGVESIAFFTGTSAYSAPNNYVDIPYTSPDGPLGQDTGINPPSTTTTDYKIFIEGATWKENTDLRTDNNYAFIGIITGNGPSATPTAFDISDQVPIFIISLDRAYDGSAGSGSGRLMFVDNEAMEIRSRTGTTDVHHASLRIDRKAGTEDGGIGLELINDQSDGKEACAVHLLPMVHSTQGLIVNNPASSTNPDLVTRTGAVDWGASGVKPRADFAWLQGFSTIDGLYAISAITATQLTLRNMDNSAPTFPNGETGNITILRIVQATGSPVFGAAALPTLSVKGPNVFTGLNEDSSPPLNAAAKFFGFANDCAFFYDTLTDSLNPTVRGRATQRGVISAEGVEVLSNPLAAFSGSDTELVHSIISPAHDPPAQIHTARAARFVNSRGLEITRHEIRGRVADVHRFKDDFNYHSGTWGTGLTLAPYYDFTGSGATPSVTPNNTTLEGGVVEISTDTTSPAIGQTAKLFTDTIFRTKGAGPTDIAAICFYAEFQFFSVPGDPKIQIGFSDGTNPVIWWEADLSVAQAWTLKANDNTAASNSEVTSPAINIVANQRTQVFIIADPFASSGSGYIGGWIQQGASSYQATGFVFPSSAGSFLSLLEMFVLLENNSASDPSKVQMDYWEGWHDHDLRSGPSK